MLSEFYHLRRTAIKDVCAYLGFLAGFIGAAPFAWNLLGDQLASGAFVKGLWYFFGIVVAAGIFTGIIGLGLGVVGGILWEHVHRYRRREYLKRKAIAEAQDHAEQSSVEEGNIDGPRLRLMRDDDDKPSAHASILLIAMLASLPIVLSAQTLSSLVGTWRGTSTCLVRPSACHDEIAVYHISRFTADTTKLTVQANKIVNGVEENMGTLEPCTFTSKTRTLSCPMPPGVRPGEWRFTFTGNAIDGGLWVPGGTKFREIHARKSDH